MVKFQMKTHGFVFTQPGLIGPVFRLLLWLNIHIVVLSCTANYEKLTDSSVHNSFLFEALVNLNTMQSLV